MNRILSIATAGLHADQVKDNKHTLFPRVDYLELERQINADTVDYSAYDQTVAGGLFRRVEREIRSDIYLTAIGWKKSREYSTVFTWSERAGIPYAGFKRLLPSNVRFVTMFQSWSKRQETTLTGLDLFRVMDAIVVHCTSMRQNLIRLGAPAEKTHVIHYSIDEEFFSPQAGLTTEPGRIVSLGETRSRDYASLFKAIEDLPVRLEVAGYGQWYAREKNNGLKEKIPANVSISRRLNHRELRDFYARCAFVVLPVCDLVYSAGATAALEAGSMARAVIAFHSQGISDYIIDGVTGILIDPGDVAGMKAAIQRLHANPAEAERLGTNARQRILEQFRLDSYVHQIAGVLLQN
jgi:glycosyltransferase involved in cell wall biosynthesis